MENRCPNGKKTTLYYRSKAEKSAEYLNQDGLVTSLTVYRDTARTDKVEVRNYFKHRTDCLLSRILECHSFKVRESFAPGRQRSLKGHYPPIILLLCACTHTHIRFTQCLFCFYVQNMNIMKPSHQNRAIEHSYSTLSESYRT